MTSTARHTFAAPDGVELAISDTQPHQAFRMAGKPMYGTQFHSELDARRRAYSAPMQYAHQNFLW